MVENSIEQETTLAVLGSLQLELPKKWGAAHLNKTVDKQSTSKTLWWFWLPDDLDHWFEDSFPIFGCPKSLKDNGGWLWLSRLFSTFGKLAIVPIDFLQLEDLCHVIFWFDKPKDVLLKIYEMPQKLLLVDMCGYVRRLCISYKVWMLRIDIANRFKCLRPSSWQICKFMSHSILSILMTRRNNRCVTLWPCHLHKKVSQDKRRIMKTQMFHHAKI